MDVEGVIKDDIELSPQVFTKSIVGTIALRLVYDRATNLWNLSTVTFIDKDGIIVGSCTWDFPASTDPDDLVREAETITSRPYLQNGNYVPKEALKPGILEDGN